MQVTTKLLDAATRFLMPLLEGARAAAAKPSATGFRWWSRGSGNRAGSITSSPTFPTTRTRSRGLDAAKIADAEIVYTKHKSHPAPCRGKLPGRPSSSRFRTCSSLRDEVMADGSLDRLAESHGIQIRYKSELGEAKEIPDAAKSALLSASESRSGGRRDRTFGDASIALRSPAFCRKARRAPRRWGVTCQLYALRSARSLGIGDFQDLGHLAEIAAAEGGELRRGQPAARALPVRRRALQSLIRRPPAASSIPSTSRSTRFPAAHRPSSARGAKRRSPSNGWTAISSTTARWAR